MIKILKKFVKATIIIKYTIDFNINILIKEFFIFIFLIKK